jgi:protein-disulfide isomerase
MTHFEHGSEHRSGHHKPKKKTNIWQIATGILGILLVVSIITGGFSFDKDLSKEEVADKTLAYINDNLLQPGMTAEVESISEEENLYSLELSVAGQQLTTYATKDGKKFFPQGFNLDEPLPVQEQPEPVEVDTTNLADDDAVKGDADAPVTIVEFSDFECPFCGRYFEQTYPKIVQNYIETGKVKYIFRDFPLSFHANAQKAAEAAECAGEQGKYFEMHDLLFANQDSLNVESYKQYAEDLGLDTEQFNTCLDSGEMADEVAADFTYGQQVGVTGTPAFFINGKMISGAQPYEAFEQVIEEALQ